MLVIHERLLVGRLYSALQLCAARRANPQQRGGIVINYDVGYETQIPGIESLAPGS
jgi:hypothetical protein